MKHFIKKLMPANVIKSRLHQQVFKQFVEKIGLVYFGYVNQRSDEHKPVRGLTVSARHIDNHYCVGSFRGYNLTLVERTDTVKFPGKPVTHHRWVVAMFDLNVAADLPHLFIGLKSHGETFYANLFTKFSYLHKIRLGNFGVHNSSFTDHYAIFAQPARMLEVEQLFNPNVTKVIADHFNHLTLEIVDNQLYVYSQQPPTLELLDNMVKYGAWLAETIESHYLPTE